MSDSFRFWGLLAIAWLNSILATVVLFIPVMASQAPRFMFIAVAMVVCAVCFYLHPKPKKRPKTTK